MFGRSKNGFKNAQLDAHIGRENISMTCTASYINFTLIRNNRNNIESSNCNSMSSFSSISVETSVSFSVSSVQFQLRRITQIRFVLVR